jgi:hypothetical protein
MKPNRRIVQEHPGGGWEVKAPKTDRASSTHSTQLVDPARSRISG